jgi:hypothetical protein
MEIYRLLVDTENWDEFGEDVESYLTHVDKKVNFIDDEERLFKANVRRWSELYRPSYMMFRHQVKQIAMKSQESLGLQARWHSEHTTFNRDQIFLVTDDDDWYHPNIAEEVVKVFEGRPDIDVVYWPTWLYITSDLTGQNKERFEIYNTARVGSNGFAIRGGYSGWFYTWGAHIKIESWVNPERKYFLSDKHLSVWNIHAASFWQRTHFELPDPINKLDKVQRPQELDWALEHLDDFNALVNSIERIN